MDKRIVTSPDVLFGKPHINGTRISVDQILSCLEEGWSFPKILKEFPGIVKKDIQACLQYANTLVVKVRITSFDIEHAKVSR